MNKVFNTSGDCKPDMHYMVDIEDRLIEMKAMVDRGDYFTVNRARQFGKTTTLKALRRYLKEDYQILSLDFLAQIRGYYIDRDEAATFQSVILAGVYDVIR